MSDAIKAPVIMVSVIGAAGRMGSEVCRAVEAATDLALVGRADKVDDVLVCDVLRLVHVRDEVLDATLVAELDRLAVDALVDQLDAQPARQERHLAQARDERGRVVLGLVEDRRVGEE